MSPTSSGGFLSKGWSRLIWFAVVGVALFLSGWSIWWLGVRFGAPHWLALFGSVAFDGGMVALTDYAVRHNSSGLRGGGFARGCGLFLLAVSITLNASHAILAHHAWVACLYYAIPSVVAYCMLEAHFRWQHAGLRPRKGDRAEVPQFHWLAWVFTDSRREAWQQIRAAVHPARELPELGRQTPELFTMIPELSGNSSGISSGSSGGSTGQLGILGDPRAVREWARGQGIEIGAHGPIPAHVEQAWRQATVSANGHRPM